MVLTKCKRVGALYLAILLTVLLIYVIFNENIGEQSLVEHLSIKDTFERQTDTLSSKYYETVFINNNNGNSSPSQSDVTIVTMYFRLNRSKHSFSEYNEWITRFFQCVTTYPLIIYTDQQSASEFILKQARQTSNAKVIYIFKDSWSLVDFMQQERGYTKVNYRSKYESIQYEMDMEKVEWSHSPELYGVWNMKPYAVYRASLAANNVFKSKYFMFSDMGAFRNNTYLNWPDKEYTERTLSNLNDRLLFSQIIPKFLDSPYLSTVRFIQAGFFAGNHKAMKFFSDTYYSIHDTLIEKDYFVGVEQKIQNLIYVYYPEQICKFYLPKQKNCVKNYDIWFVYQFYLSTQSKLMAAAAVASADDGGKVSVGATAGGIDIEKLLRNQTSHIIYLDSSIIACNQMTENVAVPGWFKCDI